jgi:hypothetical protein
MRDFSPKDGSLLWPLVLRKMHNYTNTNSLQTLKATPAMRGTVKDAREIAICPYGMVMVLPIKGVPSRKTHREVKAKLPTVEIKVMVHERLTSPWNIAV